MTVDKETIIENWYKERITGRIQKNRLIGKDFVHQWDELSQERQLRILTLIPEDSDIMLVLWKDNDKWTILTSTHIFSLLDDEFTKIKLTDIKGNFTIFNKSGMSQQELKTMADVLIFPELNKKIWIPAGQVMFGVMNTLLYVTKNYTKRPDGA